MEILPLARVEDPHQFVPEVLGWIHEAGNPYFDWLFGGSKEARRAIDTLVRSDSSELSIRHVSALIDDGQTIGGFIALGDRALRRCRSSDALALVTRGERHNSEGLRERMAAAKHLFPPVGPDEFYLSKVGVVADRRGCGLGSILVADYLDKGRAAGFERFRLDVSADNTPAISIYERAGFRVSASSDHDGLRYVAMTRGS
jgi:ribosomal protein S18 acetylase RimI-like enzyme